MARNPFEEKRVAAHRLIVHQGEDDEVAQVYQVHRIRSEDLQAAGFAEILGPESAAAAEESARTLQTLEELVRAAPDAAARAEREADYRRGLEVENERAVARLVGDEGRVRSLLERCEAYLMAAVGGIGIARADVALGVQERGTSPEDICIDLLEGKSKVPLYIRKGRLVKGPDAGPDEIPLSEIPAAERIALGLMVIAALEVTSAVTPFRGREGSARAR